MRINIFENFPVAYNLVGQNVQVSIKNTLFLSQYYIPGSISLNTVAYLFSLGTNAAITDQFALYSIDGSTLSLVNSASANVTQSGFRWRSFTSFSATSDITPGNWFLGFLESNTDGVAHILYKGNVQQFAGGTQGGPSIGGVYSVTTGAFPATIHTSEVLNIGGAGIERWIFPYILISA